MWKYIKKYIPFALLAVLFMSFEVTMDLLQPSIMSKIVDNGVLSGNMQIIIKYGLLMLGLVCFGAVCGSMNNIVVNFAAQNAGNNIRKDCFDRIMHFSFPQVDKFGTGSLVTRVTNDVMQVQNFFSLMVRGLVRTVLMTFGSLFFMFRISTTYGLISLAVFVVVLPCMYICITKANPLFFKLQKYLDDVNGILHEDISGIRIIKACVKEGYERVRFGKSNDKLCKTQFKTLVIFSLMNPIMHSAVYLLIAVILLLGSYQITDGATTPGMIMAAITYATQMLHGVLMLVMMFQGISRGSASWKRLKEVLDTEPDIVDGEFNGTTATHGKIEFNNVSFGYAGTDTDIITNVNLTINPGETFAIMGSTGCGKTSLVNLIPRFYDTTEGEILVDGVNVKDYKLKDLRQKVSTVLQKAELFSADIAENISWGKPEADMADIQKAATIAQAHEFILARENGYQTPVAERGNSMSGGQKQRISIARAILKDSDIMIFDDATSALDLKTEANLYDALSKEKPNITKIIVAQRIASVQKADRIAIIENSRIIACDTHKNLLETCDTYKDIYYSQMGKGDNKYA